MGESIRAVSLFFAGLISIFWFGIALPENSEFRELLSWLVPPFLIISGGLFISKKKSEKIFMVFVVLSIIAVAIWIF